MSDFEKISVHEYLPVLDQIKNNIETLLKMRLNTVKIDLEDPQKKPEIPREHGDQLLDENFRTISDKLKAKKKELRQKQNDIRNLENSLEDRNAHCEVLENTKKRLNTELTKIKDEHGECEAKFEDFEQQIKDLKKQLKASLRKCSSEDEKYIENSPSSSLVVLGNSEMIALQVEIERKDNEIEQKNKEIERKNKEIEEWKRKYNDLFTEINPRQSYCESDRKILRDNDLTPGNTGKHNRRSSCQQCECSKKEVVRGNIFANFLWGSPPTIKPEKTPYPEWWKKHMVN